MENDTSVDEPRVDGPRVDAAGVDEPVVDEPVVAGERVTQPTDELIDELLVEEISIDGMCGVY